MGVINQLTSNIMPKPVGGRGHRAPYETTHLRVPVPIKAHLEEIIDQYRQSLEDGPPIQKDQAIPSLEDSLAMAEKLIRAKTTKVETIKKLLTYIYKQDVNGF